MEKQLTDEEKDIILKVYVDIGYIKRCNDMLKECFLTTASPITLDKWNELYDVKK